MRLLAIILLGFLWCNLSAQVDPEQIYQAPGRDYVLLSTDTLNSSYPINGIYVPTRLRDSFYFKSDSICIGIFGDGRPDPCLLLPESGGGPSDTMYYWVFQVNGGTNDTIIQGEHINLVAGTNISITGGTDNPTINALVDTCFFTLSQLTDTTAQLTDCNGADRGTVTFSGASSLSDSCVQSMIVRNGIGSDSLFITYCDGSTPKDTVIFYPPEVNDSYIDSSFVSYNPDSISIWLYRFDTSGLIDSFPIYLPRDSMDTDSQSLDLTGNTLSITRGNSVDLSGYLDDSDTYTDSASVWFNDTVIVFRFDQDHNLVDSFPIRIPKTSFIEHDSDWLEIPTYDVPFSVEDPIFSGSTTSKRLRIGQDSLETNFNVLINGGAGPLETASSLSANLWRQRSRSTNEFWDRAQQSGFLYFRGGDTDLGSNGIYLSMQQGYSGDSVLFSIANGQIGMRQYPNYRVDGDMDDVIALYYPDALGNLNIAPVDTMKRVLADWDFVHLQDGDTSYYSSNQRDSLLPLDTSSLDSLLWRPGIVRLGDTMFYKTAYDTGGFGGGFRQEYKPQFQIANKINALDIYHWYYPYVWIRNDKSDFWIRNHNNDNTIDTLPSFLEIGAESWYDSTGTEFTSDTSNRRILRISSQSNPGAFEIHRGSIKLGDYTPDDIDTSISSTGIEAVYVPKNDGTIALTSLDTLNAALNVAASTPNITLFDRYNTGDSIALNLNATPDTAFADLSWLKVSLSGDTLIQGSDTLLLPQGADSLGTSGTANEIVYRTGGRGAGSSSNLTYNPANGSITQTATNKYAYQLNSSFTTPRFSINASSGTNVGIEYQNSGVTNWFMGAYDAIAGGNLEFSLYNSQTGGVGSAFTINGDNRAIKFDAYNSTNNTGTPTYLLGTDGSGNVVKRSFANVLSDIGAQPAGSYDNYSSWTAGSGSGTRMVTSGSQLDFLGGDSPDIATTISGSTVTFTIPNNAIQTEEITNGTILPVDLNATGAADEYILTYESTGGVFEWQSAASLADGDGIQDLTYSASTRQMQISNTGGGTGADATIPLFATGASTAGLVPGSNGATSSYLRGDGTWASGPGADDIGINGNQAGNIVLFNASASPVATQDNDFYWDAGFNVLTMDDLVIDGDTDGTQNITASQALNITAAVGGVTIAGNSGNISIGSSGSTTITDDGFFGANGTNKIEILTNSSVAVIGHDDFAQGSSPSSGSQLTFYGNLGGGADGDVFLNARGESTSDLALYASQNVGIVAGAGGSGHITTTGDVGINRVPGTNDLEVAGNASKAAAGDWLANSDQRLKKNIEQINSKDALDLILSLRGVNYEWNDLSKTLGYDRPEGKQWGMIAQDIEKTFGDDEHFVQKDESGYLNAAYGTYDPIYIEAFRELTKRNEQQAAQIKVLTDQINKLYDIVNKKK